MNSTGQKILKELKYLNVNKLNLDFKFFQGFQANASRL